MRMMEYIILQITGRLPSVGKINFVFDDGNVNSTTGNLCMRTCGNLGSQSGHPVVTPAYTINHDWAIISIVCGYDSRIAQMTEDNYRGSNRV